MTSRRLELIMRSLAAASPRSIRFASALFGRREQRITAGPAHEQSQPVRRAGWLVRLGGLRARRREDVDLAALELRPQRGELVLFEVVLGRERLERALLDRAALLRVAEERLDWLFKNGRQRSSLSSGQLPAPLEPLDAAAAEGSALEAGVGRMTVRAGVDNQLAPPGAGGKGIAACGAADGRERELRMNLLQGNLLLRGGARTHNGPRAAVLLKTLATSQLFPTT